jgi:hypothetical protein
VTKPKNPKTPPDWIKDGALAWYTPVMGRDEPRYAGVVCGDPWQLGNGAWVVNLRDMAPKYQREVCSRTRVNAALVHGAVFPRTTTELEAL